MTMLLDSTGISLRYNIGGKSATRSLSHVRANPQESAIQMVAEAFQAISDETIENVFYLPKYECIFDELSEEEVKAYSDAVIDAAVKNADTRSRKIANTRESVQVAAKYATEHPDFFRPLVRRQRKQRLRKTSRDTAAHTLPEMTDIVEVSSTVAKYVFELSDGSNWTLTAYYVDPDISKEGALASGAKIFESDLFAPGGLEMIAFKEVKVVNTETKVISAEAYRTIENFEQYVREIAGENVSAVRL